MDCTNAFEDVGHSASAYEMLKDFYIGDVVESKESVKCATSCCSSTSTATKSKNPISASCQPCQYKSDFDFIFTTFTFLF